MWSRLVRQICHFLAHNMELRCSHIDAGRDGWQGGWQWGWQDGRGGGRDRKIIWSVWWVWSAWRVWWPGKPGGLVSLGTSCLSNILFKKNIPNILFQGKIFFYIVIWGTTFKQIKNLGLFEKKCFYCFPMGWFSPSPAIFRRFLADISETVPLR